MTRLLRVANVPWDAFDRTQRHTVGHFKTAGDVPLHYCLNHSCGAGLAHLLCTEPIKFSGIRLASQNPLKLIHAADVIEKVAERAEHAYQHQPVSEPSSQLHPPLQLEVDPMHLIRNAHN